MDTAIRKNVGRPLGIRGVRVLASRHSHDCIRVLADVAGDEKAPAEARVAAAEVILGYATHKPAGGEALDREDWKRIGSL